MKPSNRFPNLGQSNDYGTGPGRIAARNPVSGRGSFDELCVAGEIESLHQWPAGRRAADAGKTLCRLFAVFVKHHDSVSRVTFWGVTAETLAQQLAGQRSHRVSVLFNRDGKPNRHLMPSSKHPSALPLKSPCESGLG